MAQRGRQTLSMEEERERLTRVITRWNEHRLDLFEIALPNENLDFYGVIRFFFQDNQQSVATTKCLRVSSTATSKMVIEALIEKFRPDMRMLGSSYALYEVHQNGEERKLYDDESPLLVQLNWSKGDRDGRFLFKQQSGGTEDPHSNLVSPTLSKGSRKEKKRRRKPSGSTSKVGGHPDGGDSDSDEQQPGALAKAIYKAVPDSRFTRSISNPEAVMRRQRQQKLVKRLQLMSSKDGRPASGGMLRVYAGSLVPEEPYKTLLFSKRTTTSQVIKIALEKYGMTGENPDDYCLVQMTVPLSSGENVHLNVVGTCTNQRLLAAHEQPLELFNAWVEEGKDSVVIFQLQKKNSVEHLLQGGEAIVDSSFMPYLVEVSPDGQELLSGNQIQLTMDRNVLGSKEPTIPFEGKFILINSNEIKPQHCEITNIEGVFTITPIDRGAEVKLNGKVIRRPAFLNHQSTIKLSKHVGYCFFDPGAFNRVAALTEASSSHTHPATATAELLNSALCEADQRALSPQPRERAQSHSVLDDAHHPRYAGRVSEDNQPNSTLSVDFEEAEKREQLTTLSSSNSAGVKENGGSRGVNTSSMPPFAYQFESPPSMLKASSEAFLSNHPSEGPEAFFLPAALSFHPTKEGPLLSNMILDLKLSTLQFKLAPAFALYMIVRYHVSPDFQPGANASELRKHLIVMLKNTVSYMKRAVKEARNTPPTLAFWMANTSELLHFLKQDPDVSLLAYEYETHLTNIVQNCFKYLFLCVTRDLNNFIAAFFEDSEEAEAEESSLAFSDSEDQAMMVPPDVLNSSRTTAPGSGTPHSTLSTSSLSSRNSRRSKRTRVTVGDVMFVLSTSLSTLRKNNVNMSLIIQLFSQFARYLNAKLVNKLMGEAQYCTRSGGVRLQRRLELIDMWAKKQGLDLTTERYLSQVLQASVLLSSPKYSMDDFKFVSFISLLNSGQVTLLLENYQLEEGEPPLSPDFARRLIDCAKMQCDKVVMRDRGIVQVEEDINFSVGAGFVLPEFGYTGQAMQGVPQGLHDYIKPYENTGLCRVVINKDSLGVWTYQRTPPATGSSHEVPFPTRDDVSSPPSSTLGFQQTGMSSSSSSSAGLQSGPKIAVINITKLNRSLDISITGGYNSSPHKELGIFVKKLVPGGSAEKDGRLQPGDQILSVDGHSLQGLTQDKAAVILKGTGDTVMLTVAKQAAMFYGLSNLITQSSPSIGRRMEAVEQAHMGSSYAAKHTRRREREKKMGFQKKPFQSTFMSSRSSSLDNFHHRGAPEQVGACTSGRDQEWPLREGSSGQKTHAGNGYVKTGGPTEAFEHPMVPNQGAELFHEDQPPSHTSVNRDEFSHTAYLKEAPEKPPFSTDRRSGDEDRGKGDDDLEHQDRYNFLSHGSQQLSQPQPPSQPQSQHTHCHPQNSSDQFSMDVQHASLASNSLPHAVMVIQGYTTPKDTNPKEPSTTEASGSSMNRQRKKLESLQGVERIFVDSLRGLDNKILEANRLKEQIEQEYNSGEVMGVVGPMEDEGRHHGRHHNFWELEERRKETRERLKQLEVDRHNSKTRLQDVQHEIKMLELAIESEESERKMEEMRGGEYSLGDRISGRDAGRSGTTKDALGMSGFDSLKRREYVDTQRVADGREGQALSTQCPPVQSADKPVLHQSRPVHPHPMGEGKPDSVDVRQLISAFSGSHHHEVSHTKPRSGTSDASHHGLKHGSDGNEGYRSLDRRREKPLDAKESQGRTKPDHQYHMREGSFGSNEVKHGSSRTRQPGVGGWDHPAPPPTLPKPFKSTASSDTVTLSTFTTSIEHYSLSPSESDFLEYPRPPPPGGNWQSPNQLLNAQMPPSSAKREHAKDVGGVPSTHSHESSNSKQWMDMEPAERRGWGGNKPMNDSAEDQQLKLRGYPAYQPMHPSARAQTHHSSTHYPSDSWRRKSRERHLSPGHQPEPPKPQMEPQGLLQFQNPPMGLEETTTSSQVTGNPEDSLSFDSYYYGHMSSHGNEPVVVPQRPEGGMRNERSAMFPSAYTSSQRLDVVGPWREQDDISSPRVMPVTTRTPEPYYSEVRRPPLPLHQSTAPPPSLSHRPAANKRPNTMNYMGKADFLMKHHQGVTTVSRTDL